MSPQVSICLPCLNAQPFLAERMETILAQTLTDWELIICDSYSNDGSWELFQKFKNDPRIRLYQVPRKGSYAGWNECLKRAQGEYVYIATADDTCAPELLEKMVGALERAGEKGNDEQDLQDQARKNIDLAVCDFDFIDEKSRIIDPPPRGTARTFYGDQLKKTHCRDGRLEFLVHTCIDISWTTITAVLFRRSLLEKTGLFRAEYTPIADKLWAVKSALYSNTVFVPERLATWRCYEAQESERHPKNVAKMSLDAVSKIIDECAELIPKEWKTGGKERLLWGMRQYYLKSYHLDRNSIRQHPLKFLGGCFRAAVHEPQYLAKRAASGFSWNTKEMMDNHEYVRKLIKEWNVPWPPKPLQDKG